MTVPVKPAPCHGNPLCFLPPRDRLGRNKPGHHGEHYCALPRRKPGSSFRSHERWIDRPRLSPRIESVGWRPTGQRVAPGFRPCGSATPVWTCQGIDDYFDLCCASFLTTATRSTRYATGY